MNDLIIIGEDYFAGKLAKTINKAMFIPLETKIFPDGEIKPRIMIQREDELTNRHVILCMHLDLQKHNINNYLLSVLLTLYAIKTYNPAKLTCILPYHVYARQDKRFRIGEPISSEIIAKIMENANINNFATITSHLDRNGELTNLFSIASTTNLSGFEVLGKELKKRNLNPKDIVVIAPDGKALPWAREIAEILKTTNYGILQKKRDLDSGKIVSQELTEDITFKDKTAIIIDDIVSSGGSMVGAANIARSKGAIDIIFAYVHAVHGIDGYNKLTEAKPRLILTTDSVNNNNIKGLTTVSVIPLLTKWVESLLD